MRFGADDDLRGADFYRADLTDARFRLTSLRGAQLRGVDLSGADVDGQIGGLQVNGVEVADLVEAELNRRWPGRAGAGSGDVGGQRASWEAAQRAWEEVVERVDGMEPGTADVSVDGEWSTAQTLRHLVFATDGWVRFGIGNLDDAFWSAGVPFTEFDPYAARLGIDLAATPSWGDVLAARRDRVVQVRDLYGRLTQAQFDSPAARMPPWEGEVEPWSVRQFLWVIVNEEWEHLRFVTRDLDVLAARSTSNDPPPPA